MIECRATVWLKNKPESGIEAYEMLIDSLMMEIEEKQNVLSELTCESVKQELIASWNADVRRVCICDVEEGGEDSAV